MNEKGIKKWEQPQFVGGCTATDPPMTLAPGWRFAEDGSPGPDFHIVRCCAFRTRPDGEYRKLYKWALRSSAQAETRERLERLRMEILREDSEAIVRAERRFIKQPYTPKRRRKVRR